MCFDPYPSWIRHSLYQERVTDQNLMNDFGKLPNNKGSARHHCTPVQPMEGTFNPILQYCRFPRSKLNLT
nr:hypothetical protein SHINE37_43220 [Rhizobiaceae bacterium]